MTITSNPRQVYEPYTYYETCSNCKDIINSPVGIHPCPFCKGIGLVEKKGQAVSVVDRD